MKLAPTHHVWDSAQDWVFQAARNTGVSGDNNIDVRPAGPILFHDRFARRKPLAKFYLATT